MFTASRSGQLETGGTDGISRWKTVIHSSVKTKLHAMSLSQQYLFSLGLTQF